MSSAFLRLASGISLAALILLPSFGLARDNEFWPSTDEHFMHLPPYCDARIRGRGTPKYDYWSKRLGRDFIHVHHYCAALHTENLFLTRRPSGYRQRMLEQALSGGYGYMEDKVGRDFVLLPEILVRKGILLHKLGEPDKALKEFQKVIALNSRYSWSYMAMADVFEENGQFAKAREVLELGLSRVPAKQAKGIRRQLEELPDSAAPEGVTAGD